MKTELFRLETGILLSKEHPLYEQYNHVYKENFAFYDEDASVYFTYPEAKKNAEEHLKDSSDMTYAVITSGVFNLTEENKAQIKETLTFNRINDFETQEDDILYFTYKKGGNLIALVYKTNE